MYLGIVGPPVDGHTDRKFFMRHVSESYTSKAPSFNLNFSPFYEETNRLKMGEWKKHVPVGQGISVEDFLNIICRLYKIEPSVSRDLCLVYRDRCVSPVAKN